MRALPRLAAASPSTAKLTTPITASPVSQAKQDLLTSIPGIGDVVARTFIAELPELRIPTKPAIDSGFFRAFGAVGWKVPRRHMEWTPLEF